jgi:hypothetical protein
VFGRGSVLEWSVNNYSEHGCWYGTSGVFEAKAPT